MRVRLFLTWFIFVTFTQATSNSGLESNLSSEQRGLNSSINNVQTKNYGSKDEGMRLDNKDKENEGVFYASIKTAHGGGRGVSGGSNVNHRPTHSGSSTRPLLSWSSTMSICLTLVLMFFFHIELH